MQTDLPHTLYFNDKGGGKNGGFKYDPDDPAIAKQMEAIRKREERMKEMQKETEGTFTMDEIFK